MLKNRPLQVIFWTATALVAVVDQLSKRIIVDGQVISREFKLLSGVFFRLAPTGNSGVVWGLFGRWPQTVLIVGILAAALVVYYFYKVSEESRPESLALGMILGGALGNLIDRAAVGYVKDFLMFTLWQYQWPTFNVADSFITIGAAVLLLSFFLGKGSAASKTSPNDGKREKSS